MKKVWPFFLLSALLCACGGESSFSPDDGEMQQAKEVTLFESKDSQNKWLLHADAVNFEDMAHAVLINPHLILREEGQDSADITGKRGVLNYSDKMVSIEGNARIHSLTQQVLLTTDRIFYDIDKDRVWSDDKTLVTRGTAKITAKNGIETDSKLKKIEFKQQTTRLPTDPKELQGVAK